MKNKNSDMAEFLKTHLLNGTWLNDFHNNYIFLEFADKFCKNLSPVQIRRKFNYEASKLAKAGLCKKSYSYLSAYDTNNFGCRTINNYQPIKKLVS